MSEEICSLEDLDLQDPLGVRERRMPKRGITMIIDKGLGIAQFQDLLDTAGSYIDFVKLGFGTTALYPPQILQAKIRMAQQYKVDVYPGGTFFEVAFHHGKIRKYLSSMQQLGFTKLEISDGTVDLPEETRREAIYLAKDLGLDVITECGKKAAGSLIEVEGLMKTLLSDLQAGSSFVIIEGRESGENVGIYDEKGKFHDDFVSIMKEIRPFNSQVIWEAPKKSQQVELINSFGPNVNLGNIPPDEIFSLESLRRGLRSDTFFWDARRDQA
ncbi:phosphosulfolactate synthase [Ammoniphilus sp. CFH 90114]|uniref:phosphosulfolactate synthase n=1 Tax=Ammoniphilus sp. CFH 90114 TaxID=2493665 RepID=UPI00100F74CC|nr:phosphosulfolactate synthase [Ammoniphilus sp. CFH 90114]RXT13772.1 phosphosulfolactate synthase [Ammoniphilus sp. CFH 90114]